MTDTEYLQRRDELLAALGRPESRGYLHRKMEIIQLDQEMVDKGTWYVPHVVRVYHGTEPMAPYPPVPRR
jgi:hypothetical protein